VGECEELSTEEANNTVPPDDPDNATVDFHGEKRSNQTHASKTDRDAKIARKGKDKEAKLSYNWNLLVENHHGLIVNTEVVRGQRNRRTRCRAGDAGTDSGHETSNGGRRQGI
jgi:hypothetical protein